MQETGTYNQQWRRSFESNLTGNVHNAIMENCEKVGRITPGLLTGVANQFVRPSATPERPISIINGWDVRRFRFFMEIHSKSHIGNTMIQYVTGYTDHYGCSATGALDPNMVFYINSVSTTRSSIRTTPMGAQNVQAMMDSSHLLYQTEYPNNFTTPQGQTHKMRPEDIFVGMQNADLRNDAGDTGNDNDFMDTRTYLTTKPVKASRRHSSSPVWVASILDAYVQTSRAASLTGASSIELYDTASGHVSAARTNTDPFIKKLIDSGNGGTFTFSELTRIDPDIGTKIIVAPLTPALRATLHSAGQTQNWQGSDYETQFATTLSQAVPGYMLDNCLQAVRFNATNDTAQGILVFVTNFDTLLQGIDPAPYLGAFSHAVQNTLLKDLTYNNQLSFNLEMSCNLIGDTRIELSLNGGPRVPYVSPCFCDNLMSPLVTSDFNRFTALANDLCTVVDYLADATTTGIKPGFIDTQTSFI
jgi:hypothetical protein